MLPTPNKPLMITAAAAGISALILGKLWLDTRDEKIALSVKLEYSQQTLEAERLQFAEQVKKVDAVHNQLRILSSQSGQVLAKLDKYRRQEHVAVQKPEAIERLARAATRRLFDDIYFATCPECQTETPDAESNRADLSDAPHPNGKDGVR